MSHCTFIHCDHADFVVLEQDLFTVSPEKISETTVKETYVAGQCVYQK
ncbi:amidohydrolase family protein [Kurthia gibsonii]